MRLFICIATLAIGLAAVTDAVKIKMGNKCPSEVLLPVKDGKDYAQPDLYGQILKKVLKKMNDTYAVPADMFHGNGMIDRMRFPEGKTTVRWQLSAEGYENGKCEIDIIVVVPRCHVQAHESLVIYHDGDMVYTEADVDVGEEVYKMCNIYDGYAPHMSGYWMPWYQNNATLECSHTGVDDENDIPMVDLYVTSRSALNCSQVMCYIDDMYHYDGYVVYDLGNVFDHLEDDEDDHDADHHDEDHHDGSGSGGHDQGEYIDGSRANLYADYGYHDVIIITCDYENGYYPVNITYGDDIPMDVTRHLHLHHDHVYKIVSCDTGMFVPYGNFVHLYGYESFTCERCPADQGLFSCGDDECVPDSWQCDGYPDCRDGSDEYNCGGSCNVTCTDTGMCIPDYWSCDGWRDCDDGSDELDCPCDFACNGSDHCIRDSWVCDGEYDCRDGDDEVDCPCLAEEGRLQCNGTLGLCIWDAWRCDGDNDCRDNEDEQGCPCEYPNVRCNNTGSCIRQGWICDGYDDCGDFEDEQTCDYCFFQCTSSSRCLPAHWLCDYDRDCPDGEDEACDLCHRDGDVSENPTSRSCVVDGIDRCVIEAWECDGIEDCDEGEDEAFCQEIYCGEDEFMCHDRSAGADGVPSCIQASYQCDHVEDCSDGSDEINCGRLQRIDLAEGGTADLALWLHLGTNEYVPVCYSDWPGNADNAPEDDNGIPMADVEACALLGGRATGASVAIHRGETRADNNGVVVMHRDDEDLWSRDEYSADDQCPNGRNVVGLQCSFDDVCGTRNELYRQDTLIGDFGTHVIHGTTAENGTWPWQVVVKYNNYHICGGTLINNRWVVTAAHCVDGSEHDADAFTVVLGNTYIYGGVTRQVTQIIKHENYRGNTIKNDVALLKIERVDYDALISPVCVPEPDYDFSGSNAVECYTSGWGGINPYASEFPLHLQQARMHLINEDVCANNEEIEEAGIFFPTKMLCAGYEHGYVTVCNGDSGGPLMCRNKYDQWYLAGVVSWGPIDSSLGVSCMGISVYAKVTAFSDWFETNSGLDLF